MFDSIFGDLFDLNNDGKLDTFERGAEFALLNELMKQTENDDDDYDNWDFDD